MTVIYEHEVGGYRERIEVTDVSASDIETVIRIIKQALVPITVEVNPEQPTPSKGH